MFPIRNTISSSSDAVHPSTKMTYLHTTKFPSQGKTLSVFVLWTLLELWDMNGFQNELWSPLGIFATSIWSVCTTNSGMDHDSFRIFSHISVVSPFCPIGNILFAANLKSELTPWKQKQEGMPSKFRLPLERGLWFSFVPTTDRFTSYCSTPSMETVENASSKQHIGKRSTSYLIVSSHPLKASQVFDIENHQQYFATLTRSAWL